MCCAPRSPAITKPRLVRLLRERGKATISLVAIVQDQLVGHVLFSPVTSEIAAQPDGLGLGPLAVLPTYQRMGIGHQLSAAGISECRARGAAYIVVLGDPAYYARFGFRPAAQFGFTSDYDAGDAFQAIELHAGALDKIQGRIRYCEEFAELASDSDPSLPIE